MDTEQLEICFHYMTCTTVTTTTTLLCRLKANEIWRHRTYMLTMESVTAYLGAGCCTLALGGVNLLCWVPMLLRLLSKRVAWMHAEVTSDIPGNPHAFDDSIISLFRTLPELNNFNIVWTSLPLSEPLLLKGSVPHARINSLSVYAPNAVPNSIDLAKADKRLDGIFEIKIENSSTACSSNFLSTNDWGRGFLVMRNYLVPPGTRVVTPAILRASDGTVVREAQVLTAGPPSTALQQQSQHLTKAKKLLVTNAVFLLLCKYLLNASARSSVMMMLCAAWVAAILYKLLFIAGGRSLKKLSSIFCPRTNELFPVALEKGAEVSQPSTMHKYWMMQLDIPVDAALHIKGKIKPENQKYWSLTVYDEAGVPLPQFVFDENANKTMRSDFKGAYDFDVCITMDPDQAGINDSNGTNVIDISWRPEMRKGYVLFRLVHPVEPAAEVEAYSSPSTSLRAIYGSNGNKNSIKID